MSRELVLGLDGGGSKTVVALADRDGKAVALLRGPGLDPYGNPGWREDLRGSHPSNWFQCVQGSTQFKPELAKKAVSRVATSRAPRARATAEICPAAVATGPSMVLRLAVISP